MSDPSPVEELDYEQWPHAAALLATCKEFFAEVLNLTPGRDLEIYLNKHYGPGNRIFDEISKYIKLGMEEGWCAPHEIDGKRFRRCFMKLPGPDTRFFSITTVYMEGQEVYSGTHHSHPYGEINCVIPLGDGRGEMKGMQGWQGAGWTSPGAGTHHYPQVRNGSLVSLFFLPAGRISFQADPNAPQPEYV